MSNSNPWFHKWREGYDLNQEIRRECDTLKAENEELKSLIKEAYLRHKGYVYPAGSDWFNWLDRASKAIDLK